MRFQKFTKIMCIFTYRLNANTSDRFKKAFIESDNSLITIKRSHFILLNSVTLFGDGCSFCAKTDADIEHMSLRLNCAKHKSNASICSDLTDNLPFYARPILIQHYPTYRADDRVCLEHDYAELEEFKENREVLSKNATEFVGKSLHPAVTFCGHSHHYCRSMNMWGGEEFTIASFSWQHKSSPSFLLVHIFFYLNRSNEIGNRLTKCTMSHLLFRQNFRVMIMPFLNVICQDSQRLFLFTR